MAYSQSQSLNQLNLKIYMHTPLFDLYLHLSQLILIHDTHILKNQWEFKRSNIIFLKKITKKPKLENQHSPNTPTLKTQQCPQC